MARSDSAKRDGYENNWIVLTPANIYEFGPVGLAGMIKEIERGVSVWSA
jgi:hypothetical protein